MCIRDRTATVPGANEAPVISNAKITNVSQSGYTVTCTVTDDNAVDRVLTVSYTHLDNLSGSNSSELKTNSEIK